MNSKDEKAFETNEIKKEYSIISNIPKIKFLGHSLNKEIMLFIKAITIGDKRIFNIYRYKTEEIKNLFNIYLKR